MSQSRQVSAQKRHRENVRDPFCRNSTPARNARNSASASPTWTLKNNSANPMKATTEAYDSPKVGRQRLGLVSFRVARLHVQRDNSRSTSIARRCRLRKWRECAKRNECVSAPATNSSNAVNAVMNSCSLP